MRGLVRAAALDWADPNPVAMTPRRLIGLLLIVVGVVIVALRGVSYTRERQSVEIGNLELAAERKGFVHPGVGLLLMVVGGGLVFYPARKT